MDKYRESFFVNIYDANPKRGQLVTAPLQQAGYNSHLLSKPEELKSSTLTEPPHFLFLIIDKTEDLDYGIISTFKAKVPDQKVVLYFIDDSGLDYLKLYKLGVSFIGKFPLVPLQFIRMADFLMKYSLYEMQIEQVKAENQSLRKQKVRDEHLVQSQFDDFKVWLSSLMEKDSLHDIVEHFMLNISRVYDGSSVVYLKYLPGYQSLVISQCIGRDLGELRNVGIKLREVEPNFKYDLLKTPTELTSLNEVATKVLGYSKFRLMPLLVDGKIKGIFIFDLKNQLNRESVAKESYSTFCLDLLAKRYEHIDAMDRLQKFSPIDEESNVLGRHFLLKKIGEEVSRARRTQLPVSFVIVSIDQYNDILLNDDPHIVERVLKNIAGLLVKNSRVNDIVGRLASDEFGLILPNTGQRGATIKSERLRKIIQNADFSKLLPMGSDKVTVSIGVSEYPTLCMDTDDLLKTADEALYQIKKSGSNKVCLASPRSSFTPDFVVRESV